MNTNYQKILDDIKNNVKKYYGLGNKARYIPALGKIDPEQFGISLIDNKKNHFHAGDTQVDFSIQSVSKVFTLTMVLNEVGEELWGRMDREPSGKSFDSLIHLEESNGIPSNPFLNTGAIVLADALIEIYGSSEAAFEKYKKLLRQISGNSKLDIDQTIYNSEKISGHKNYAFAYYMKSYGNILNEVDDVLNLYFKFCSLKVNNEDLAKSFYFLSNHGVGLNGEQVTSSRHCKRINSLMFTTGTYNEVGDFAYLVGLPVKSGVSGAIAGCLPEQYSVSVWSPELNAKGNSYLGFKALEELTTVLDDSYLS